MGELICMTDPEQTALRDVELRRAGPQRVQEVPANWPLRGGTVRADGIGGNVGLQAEVGTPTRPALLDEVVPPPGFVLLGRDCDPVGLLTPTQHEAWRQLGGRSVHFGPGGLKDAAGKYAQWFVRLNASVVLIRPDFQVFGGVLDPNATDGLVRDLVERIRA